MAEFYPAEQDAQPIDSGNFPASDTAGDQYDASPTVSDAPQRPHIADIATMDNVMALLSETELLAIGRRVKEDYEVDKETMQDWLSFARRVQPLVTQVMETKTFPFDGSTNTRLPLIINAVTASHAEEISEIIRDDQVIKVKLFGRDNPDKDGRAERVTNRLNWQFFYGIPEWAEGHDRAVLFKNLLGTVHKKIYWCKESHSYECDVLPVGVIINDNTASLRTAPRVTHEIELPWWSVEEKFLSEEWTRVDLTPPSLLEGTALSDKAQEFLEQIRREDIDQDGYPEPYIVTTHKATDKVVCIKPNFTLETIWFKEKPDPATGQMPPNPQVVKIDTERGRVRYVKYGMLPSLDGGYWWWGYNRLLGPLTDNCNTLINQIIDANTLAITGGGFISDGVRFSKEDGGRLSFDPGEWKRVKVSGSALKDSIVPLPVREASAVAFQLLGLLIQITKEAGNQTDLMQGQQQYANMPASSTLALLEQGKKSFGPVYKRHRRALALEAKAVFDLEYQYADPEEYALFCDIPNIDPKQDFTMAGMDLIPVAEPEYSSRATRMAESEAVAKYLPDPRVNGSMILKRIFYAILNDREVAAQMVPDEPNKTPEQMMQALEQQKAQFMTEQDVQLKLLDVQIKNLDLDIKQEDLKIAEKQANAPVQKAAA